MGGARLVKRAAQLAHFAGRFWPLWLPLVLIWAWPLTRPVARLQMFGSPLTNYDVISISEIWGELLFDNYRARENPLPDAAAHPTDLNLHVWQWSWMKFWNGETATRPVDATLSQRFPNQAVVYALEIRQLNLDSELENIVIRKAASGLSPPGNGPGGGGPGGGGLTVNGLQISKIERLEKLASAGRQLEPDNAFWPIQQAVAQELRGQDARARALLERAARCRNYDDKTREMARRALAAFAARRALAWEEKLAITVQIVGAQESEGQARYWGNRARVLAKRGDAKDALRVAGAMAAIGALMQRPDSTGANSAAGTLWQSEAWRVAAPPKITNKGRRPAATGASERFAVFAARNGRADLVATTRAQAAQTRANERLFRTKNYYDPTDAWLRVDGLDTRLEATQIGGVVLICAAIYLAVWWMLANIFLARAGGAPSSRAARLGLSSAVVLSLVGLALWSAWWFATHDSYAPPPAAPPSARWRLEALQVVFGSMSAFAFAGRAVRAGALGGVFYHAPRARAFRVAAARRYRDEPVALFRAVCCAGLCLGSSSAAWL